MDIEYLLFLQNFRNSIGDAWTPFMQWVSDFGTSFIMFFPVFIYWCIDKRTGLMIFAANKISLMINSLIKLTCCIYRPWVRDARILPAGNAIKTAGGYSFPSCHTMIATPIYGGLAMLSRNKFIKIFWAAAFLITAFSRNYLGVHTPQDVVVGMILGLLSLYAAAKIFEYLDAHPELEDIFIILCFIAGVLTLVYISYKSYPLDYNAEGKLIVDPVKMQIDSWQDTGGIIALAACWLIEKKFIKFEATGFNLRGVILNLIGMIPLYFILNKTLRGYLVSWQGAYWGRLINQFALFCYVMIIWPLILKFFTGKKN